MGSAGSCSGRRKVHDERCRDAGDLLLSPLHLTSIPLPRHCFHPQHTLTCLLSHLLTHKHKTPQVSRCPAHHQPDTLPRAAACLWVGWC